MPGRWEPPSSLPTVQPLDGVLGGRVEIDYKVWLTIDLSDILFFEETRAEIPEGLHFRRQ